MQSFHLQYFFKKEKKKEGSFLEEVSPHLPPVHSAHRRCFAVSSLKARSAASQFAFLIAVCLEELQPAWSGLLLLLLMVDLG